MECIRDAGEVGIPFQINTTVTRRNLKDLPNIARLVEGVGAVLWDLFFLVPVGRGTREDVISPDEHEQVFHWLYDLSKNAPYGVKTTQGQHYRRVVLQREGFLFPPSGTGEGSGHLLPSTGDGKGVCFVSHIGEIYPSGFLPIVAGQVRRDSLVDVYQNSPLFRDLRDPTKLKGKCGYCPFNILCGGSRARAYGFTGDYLAEEPCCVYLPPKPS